MAAPPVAVAEPAPAPPPAEEPAPAYTGPAAQPGFSDEAVMRARPVPEPMASPPVPTPPAEPEDEPAAEPEAEEPPPPEPIAADAVPPPPVVEEEWDEEEYSQFDSEPPFRRRRNTLKMWTLTAAIFAVIALGTVVGASYWGLPDWIPVSRPTFGLGQPDLVLDFPADEQDRHQLPDGSEYFGASGSVTNVGRETRSIPTILIVLRDASDRIVYRWEIQPPQNSLAPGETVAINRAVRDIPKSAEYAEFGWKAS